MLNYEFITIYIWRKEIQLDIIDKSYIWSLIPFIPQKFEHYNTPGWWGADF